MKPRSRPANLAPSHSADATSAISPLLEASGLSKSYGPLRAVDGIDFSLAAGEFLTVFGPNGAGKTTLLRLLAGGLRPSAGEVRLSGEALDPQGTEWRTRIGILSHQSFLYGHLTGEENLRFYAALYGVRGGERVQESLARVGLADRADARVRTYSRGMRQRLALARTLLHDPELVLLDEPYTGLDAHASAVLKDVLVALKDGRRSVVMVTHNLAEGLELADRVAIQVRGRFVHHGPAGEAREQDFARHYVRAVEAAG